MQIPYGYTRCELYRGFAIAVCADSLPIRYAGFAVQGKDLTHSYGTKAEVRQAIGARKFCNKP